MDCLTEMSSLSNFNSHLISHYVAGLRKKQVVRIWAKLGITILFVLIYHQSYSVLIEPSSWKHT